MKKAKRSVRGPLDKIRILDLTRLYPGPLGTMMLADMGAEVIKIEDINNPDYMRYYPPYLRTESAGFLAVNRSKRSVAINLGAKKGVELFFLLVKTADVVIEQFRPGIIDKMGIGYKNARKIKKDIIYVSLTGYGQNGPYAMQAGHDINYIGYSGILASTGTKETGPVIPGAQIADVAGGAYMTIIACLSALWAREKTGRGQQVDISMLDAILPLMTLQMAHYQAVGILPEAGQAALSGGLACYNVYQCADGKYVALGILEEKFWKNFCEVMRHSEWLDRQFVVGEEADKLRGEISALFLTKTRDEWIIAAADHDICLTPVVEIAEIENNYHLQTRNMIIEQKHPACGKIKGFGVPLKFSRTPAKPGMPAPSL
ncbi:MAG TPA: CaiB/BaiF CoA-transferase family protein, partial [Smithellaceae bacterium]|nr:CaiB/BaiF CoA-transferase family protein [Smithellaceae bacterium]